MSKEYFSIAFAQLTLNLDYNQNSEYLIADDTYFKQMEKVLEIIKNKPLDILIFPEMSFHEKYENFFLNYSQNKLIVFGSVYKDNSNFTVVFHNKNKYLIKKIFNSAVEPAIRYDYNISTKDFIKNHLKEHTFTLHNKKFIVLNCAEYYKTAYLIAREEKLNKNLFAFLVPCANNNNDVFLTESMALHNHNENIYSFIVNSSSRYKNIPYSTGGSYVFGKLSTFEKELSSINRLNHPSSICMLDNDPCLVEGMYLLKTCSTYYRSDNFRHTPINIKIHKLGEI